MSLFANVPNFIFGILTTIFLAIYLFTGSDGIYALFLIFNTIMRFHASMYLGVITAIVPSSAVAESVDYIEFLIEAILFTVLPMISVLVTQLAYTLGSKEKKLLSFMSTKK